VGLVGRQEEKGTRKKRGEEKREEKGREEKGTGTFFSWVLFLTRSDVEGCAAVRPLGMPGEEKGTGTFFFLGIILDQERWRRYVP
jgi:hypothetical protein